MEGWGRGVVNERGEGGRGRSDSDAPSRVPPTGEIFFIPFLYLVKSEHLTIPDPIFYL